jgi:hypothetical protein
VTEEHEFSGVFVSHWEVPRFCVVSRSRLFGLFPRVEKYEAHFPLSAFDTFELRAARHGPARNFRMRLRGHLGPRGHFGHMGMCSHQLFVSEILECAETSEPGAAW